MFCDSMFSFPISWFPFLLPSSSERLLTHQASTDFGLASCCLGGFRPVIQHLLSSHVSQGTTSVSQFFCVKQKKLAHRNSSFKHRPCSIWNHPNLSGYDSSSRLTCTCEALANQGALPTSWWWKRRPTWGWNSWESVEASQLFVCFGDLDKSIC